jgi:hypothetical protein
MMSGTTYSRNELRYDLSTVQGSELVGVMASGGGVIDAAVAGTAGAGGGIVLGAAGGAAA